MHAQCRIQIMLVLILRSFCTIIRNFYFPKLQLCYLVCDVNCVAYTVQISDQAITILRLLFHCMLYVVLP